MTRRRELFHIKKLKRIYNRKTDTFTYNITYQTAPAKQTQRTKDVAEAFGIATNTKTFALYDNTSLKIKPTDIVLITGDSGSGKSTLLKALKQDLQENAADPDKNSLNTTEAIIDTIGENTAQAIEKLSKVGLTDAFLFLRSYNELSDGQKHRYQIAKLAETKAQWWILDEFTNTLDRDTAKIVAFNLQKLARQKSKAVIAATTQNDLMADLAPNVHVHKHYGREIEVTYNAEIEAEQCSLTSEMSVQQGTMSDYKQLSEFHYRGSRCPAPRKIFTLKRGKEVCGVIVYSYPSPTCFGRSKVWKGTVKQLQLEVSLISRVVVHPKYRGISLGSKLVRETLHLAGTPYVEAVAVMAKYNPFFERAGMQKVAESNLDLKLVEVYDELAMLGFEVDLLADNRFCEQKILEVGVNTVKELLLELSRCDAGVR